MSYSRIERVVLMNYKSIAPATVQLGPLTFLVGPNGAGKSNFIDALRFCRDALRTPLDQVFAKRNTNLHSLLHQPSTHSDLVEMHFQFALKNGHTGSYSFEIGPHLTRGFELRSETCKIRHADGHTDSFALQSAALTSHNFSAPVPPATSPNRLYLVNASGIPEFQPVYELLSGMEFYSPDPAIMHVDLDTTGSSGILDSDGKNTARVLDRLSRTQPDTKARIVQYLRAIVPGLERVETSEFEFYKLLNFYMTTSGSLPSKFLASSMSDGTLRALALLVALFQNAGSDSPATLIAIEEPETGLHPAATAVLLDALREASESVQVIVTSHSSDLLDNSEIRSDELRAVYWENDGTAVLDIDDASRSAMRDRLYTAGELLRMGRLQPASGNKSPTPLSQ